MNKAQLIEALAERLGDKKTAGAAVDGLVDVIVRSVNKGEKVNITGFGVFEKRARAARTARNPRTGETVKVKKTNVPAFRPGSTFKDVISGAKKLAKVAAAKPAAKPAAAKPAAAKPRLQRLRPLGRRRPARPRRALVRPRPPPRRPRPVAPRPLPRLRPRRTRCQGAREGDRCEDRRQAGSEGHCGQEACCRRRRPPSPLPRPRLRRSRLLVSLLPRRSETGLLM